MYSCYSVLALKVSYCLVDVRAYTNHENGTMNIINYPLQIYEQPIVHKRCGLGREGPLQS